MSIQTQIQETQSLSFEKRQERETQTDNLHKGIIEKERETHEWFKLTIQKQHALLEKELSLEREISSKRSLYMGEKFKVEAEQLHELENIRVAGQNEIQQYKETRLKKREKDYKEHENLLFRYNSQINELDAKLLLTSSVQDSELRNKKSGNSTNVPGGQPGEDGKKCILM